MPFDVPLNFGKDLSTSFDAVAPAYDRARPEYPREVFERILEYAQLRHFPADIVEIGSGTGKATGPFALLGHRLLCLEPGSNLAEFARARFATLPNVLVLETSFERWDPAPASFEIAFVAQAFHWLDPALRLPKLASVLRSSGSLAIFGHSSVAAPPELNAAIQTAYRDHAPSLAERDNAKLWYSSSLSPITEEISASHLFCDFEFYAIDWSRELSSEAYCDLLGTYSDHSTLRSAQLAPLLDVIRNAILENGDILRLEYRTGLFLARVA